MKKHIITAIIVIIAIFFTPAFAQKQQGLQKIRLNPDAALGGNASQFISSVHFIPLENTKQTLINNHSPKMVVTPTHIIVIKRYYPTEVLIFSRSGKFITKFTPGDDFYQLNYDKKNNFIELSDDNFSKVIYDMNGKLVKKIIQKAIWPEYFARVKLNDKYTACANMMIKNKDDSLVYQLLIYKDTQLVGSYLPYPKDYVFNYDDEPNLDRFTSSFNGGFNGVLFSSIYDYKLYEVTPAGVNPIYQFLFPAKYSLPVNFMDSSYNGKREKYIFKKFHGGEVLISGITDFYKTGNTVFFATDLASYALDLQTQVFVCYNNILPDSLSYYLPIDEPVTIGEGSDYLNKRYGFSYFDGTYFYTTVPAQVLFNAMEANKSKKVVYPPELVEFFKNKQNRRGNPVLVQVKFKKSF